MIHETFSHYNIGFIRHRACCGNEEKHFFLRASVPNFSHSHSRNARVHARIRRFSCFCLHLFTFRLYLAENKRLAGEGFTIWKNELSPSCSMTYGWRQLPSPQRSQRGAASRQKRRSKVSRSTTAQRVKATHRKVHPLAFTRNALWFKWLRRFLTRVWMVKPSPVRCLFSADCDQKCTRWRQKNENLLCARNARAWERSSSCDGADSGWLKTDFFSPKAHNIGEKVEGLLLPLVLSTFSGQL